MRCLFCGKTLPLLKKLQKREFCSKAHRQQHNRLALARLTEPKHEPELPAADFVACARLAIGSVHPEPVEPHGDTPTAGFAAEVVRPTRSAPETLAGGGERLTRAAVLLPALQATSTRPVPTSAPWLPDPAIPLPGSMSLRGPAVWRGQPGATTLFADLGEPEAGPGQHGFRLPTAAAEPRDIPAREQLSSYKDWGVRVATQRLRFQPLEFVVAPLPAPRSGPRDRVRNRWRSARAPLRVALLTLPLIGAGLAMLPWEKQIFAEKIGPLLRERAAIVLEDDFRSGLSGWGGGSGWAREWQYDLAGFVRPGKLALLNASLALSDYRLEFVGEIEKKSLGWVFRASDVRNFYAMKITIAKPGPLPQGDIVRYVVVNGIATDRVELPLPMSIRNDTLYRVETAAERDRFITSVNGQVVDTFRDGRHPTGGVGLFSEPGEAAHIMRVRVADGDDLVGRVCAYFSGDSTKSKTANPPIVRMTN